MQLHSLSPLLLLSSGNALLKTVFAMAVSTPPTTAARSVVSDITTPDPMPTGISTVTLTLIALPTAARILARAIVRGIKPGLFCIVIHASINNQE